MSCKFHNKSNMDVTDFNPLAKNLMGYMQKKVGFNKPPSAITYQDDSKNAEKMLGKTAYYNPSDSTITVFVTKRHPKDILRSIAHELIHHKQNEDGKFEDIGEVGEGYAQSNDKLRGMERQAYEMGNMCFRDWEDGYKNAILESIYKQQQTLRRNKTMDIHKWKNNELNRLLMERFGIKSEKEYNLEEDQDRIFAPNHYCAHHVVHEGQEAYTVDHNWDSKKQKVTKYDIRFRDGTVKRNVPTSELTVLQAFNEGEHGNRDKHPPVKDANEEKDEEKGGNKKTDKHDDNPKLKGGQKNLPDALQKGIIGSKGDDSEEEKEKVEEANDSTLAAKAVKWLEDNPDSKLSQEKVEKAIMDNNGKVPKDLKESKKDRIFRNKVRLMLESFNFNKTNKRRVTVRKRRK